MLEASPILSMFPDKSLRSSVLKEGESCAAAKPRRVTSENSFLSPVTGGLVDGALQLPNAKDRTDVT